MAPGSVCSLHLQGRECKGDEEKRKGSGAVLCCDYGRNEKFTLTEGLARLERCRRVQAPIESGTVASMFWWYLADLDIRHMPRACAELL